MNPPNTATTSKQTKFKAKLTTESKTLNRQKDTRVQCKLSGVFNSSIEIDETDFENIIKNNSKRHFFLTNLNNQDANKKCL